MSAQIHQFRPRDCRPCDSELPRGSGAVTPVGYYGPKLTVGEWVCACMGVSLGALFTYLLLCSLLVV